MNTLRSSYLLAGSSLLALLAWPGVAAPSRTSMAQVPFLFEKNVGQDRGRADFLARGAGYTLRLTATQAELALRARDNGAARITMTVENGAAGAPATGLQPSTGKVNYLWEGGRQQTGVPAYGRVRYAGVYPGIDLVYHGKGRQLEYDFNVQPGADPGLIRLAFAGMERLSVNDAGQLVLAVNGREVRFDRPFLYQEDAAGRRMQVDGRFQLLGNNRAGFVVGKYDRGRELVIDPTLSYATYFGGTKDDVAWGIAVDAAGNSYITGSTSSSTFRTTAGALQTRYGGSGEGGLATSGDAYVMKLNPAGELVYSTFFGGSADDIGWSIAVDAAGNAYVAGNTQSTDFPVTDGALQRRHAGKEGAGIIPAGDAFIAKLNPAGTALVYSTLLGGSSHDRATSIAVDATGNVYVAGNTMSANFPVSADAFQRTYRGSSASPNDSVPFGDAWVAKLNAAGSALTYSSYMGGTRDEVATGIVIDTDGNAYLTGWTMSADFPTTTGALQTTYAGPSTKDSISNAGDAFVTKVNARGTALVFSTYLGGKQEDAGWDLALDAAGNVYVGGRTYSLDFPVTPRAFKTTFTGHDFGFVAKLNAAGAALTYSTLIGSGDRWDLVTAIEVDSTGAAYIAGVSKSRNFPTTAGAAQRQYAGADTTQFWDFAGDGFFGKLSPADVAFDLGIDRAGNAYVVGFTASRNFPATEGALQRTYGGDETILPRGDIFFTKITGLGAPASPTPTAVAAAGGSTNLTGTAGRALAAPVEVVVRDASNAPVAGVRVAFTATNATVDPAAATTDAQGRASTRVTPGTAGTATVVATVTGLAPVTFTIAVSAAPAGPAVRAVLNGASFTADVAPGSIVSLFFENVPVTTAGASAIPFPTTLGGVSVTVNGRLCPLVYVGQEQNQINAQLPFEIQPGPATAVITAGQVSTPPFAFNVRTTAPGIIFYGGNHAVAVNQNGSLNASAAPAPVGSVITVYMVGQGATDPAVPTGGPAPSGPLARPVAAGSVKIGDATARVLFLGMTPGAVGLLQANVEVPELPAGDHPMVVTIGGAASNTAILTVGPAQ